jgi:hypothetical protein
MKMRDLIYKDSTYSISASLYGWMRDGHLYTVDGTQLGFYDDVTLFLEEGEYTFDNLMTTHRGYACQLSYEFRRYGEYDMKEIIAQLDSLTDRDWETLDREFEESMANIELDEEDEEWED